MGKLAHISEMACRIWKWHENDTYFYLKNASNLSIIQTFWTFQVSLVHSAGQGVERERNAIIAVLIDLFWCIPGELHQNGFWCQSPCWLWAWLSQLWLLKVQFLHNLLHVLPSISLFVLLDKQIHLTSSLTNLLRSKLWWKLIFSNFSCT